jgi:hypothetical protein
LCVLSFALLKGFLGNLLMFYGYLLPIKVGKMISKSLALFPPSLRKAPFKIGDEEELQLIGEKNGKI